MDQAIWATWYDLPEEGRDTYLTWVHGTYIPRLLKKPGFLNAAHYLTASVPPTSRLRHADAQTVPGGNTYILIFSGENAHAFGTSSRRLLHEELPPEDKKMLAMRMRERVSIFTDVARVEGPAAGQREGQFAFGPAVQFGSFASGTADEEEILEFYARGRMPEMAKAPGCLRMRKMIAVAGWAKHGCLYEFESVDKLKYHFANHAKLDDKQEVWTDTLVRKLVHAPGTPVVASRIWPPVA